MFHVGNGLYFDRLADGSVKVIKRKSCMMGEPIVFEQVLDVSTWASVVLSMTAHSERAGDHGAWEAHHKGTKDVLAGQRGGY